MNWLTKIVHLQRTVTKSIWNCDCSTENWMFFFGIFFVISIVTSGFECFAVQIFLNFEIPAVPMALRCVLFCAQIERINYDFAERFLFWNIWFWLVSPFVAWLMKEILGKVRDIVLVFGNLVSFVSTHKSHKKMFEKIHLLINGLDVEFDVVVQKKTFCIFLWFCAISKKNTKELTKKEIMCISNRS